VETPEKKQFVDPAVTEVKFSKEIEEFKANENGFRKKGIICAQIGRFTIDLLFGVPHLTPAAVAFAITIDYSNWDVEPPSVIFIDPFSGRFLQREEIKVNLWQVPDKSAVSIQNNQLLGVLDLLQPQGGDNMYPFVCIPGVKEYHQHAAHSGDSWMLYRSRGEGKLCVLIDQLYRHSIPYIAAYQLHIAQIKAIITGLSPDLNKLQE
jgi:hypothetical protein